MSGLSRHSGGRFEFGLLLLFTALGLALLACYEFHDGRPPTYDDAWYLETSLHLYDAIRDGDAVRLVYEYCGALGGIKAPLISVLPLPFFLAFGKRIDPTFWINGFFLIVTNLYLFALVRRWFSLSPALLAVIVYQTFPIVAGVSRTYMTDYAQAALVLAFLYHLAASDHLRDTRSNIALGILLGLGLLMKVSFPAWIAAPVFVIWRAARKRSPAVNTLRPLLTIGLIAASLAFPWYALNLRRVLVFAWSNAFGSVGEDYVSPSFADWIVGFTREGISVYYACAGLLLIPVAFVILWRRGKLQWREQQAFLLAWVLPPGVALIVAGSASARHDLPILPAIAIVFACSMVVVGRAISPYRAVQALLYLVVLAVPLSGFVSITLDRPLFDSALYAQSYWFRQPDNAGQWNQLRILDTLRKLAPEEHPSYPVIVGVEHRYLNANLLSYLRYREDGPFRFASFAYAETSVEHAVEQIRRTRPRFILMADGIDENDLAPFLNRVNEPVQQLLDRHALPFRDRGTIPLTGAIRVRVYESESWPFAAAP